VSRRPGGPGVGGDAAGNGARGLVLLAVALLLAVFVLNQTDPGGSSTGSDETSGSTATTLERTSGTTLAPTTLPRAAKAPAELKLLPANGSGVGGLGGRVADRLKAKGYTNTLAAVNTTRDITASAVEYAKDFEPEARAVAEALGLPPTVVRPLDSPPVLETRDAHVIVLIGPDLNTTSTTTAGSTTATTARTARANTTTTRP